MATLISEGPLATEGAREAAALLKHLPEPWLVIANKTIVQRADRSFEVDFVVVGSDWVFIADVWNADASIVRAWQTALRASELRPATISQFLASVSSFYEFALASGTATPRITRR